MKMQRAGRMSYLARQAGQLPLMSSGASSLSPFLRHCAGRTLHTTQLTAAEIKAMKVLWGSQTGTATGLADDLARELSSAGIAASSIDLRKYNPKKLSAEKDPIVLVMACYGTGEPTDNAKPFYDFVMSKDRKAGSLKDVQYTVFGLGQSKAYPACYQAVGRAMDKRLEELGAQRFFERGEGDDSEDVEGDFTSWKEKLLQSVTSESPAEASDSGAASQPATPTKIEPEKPSVEIKVLGKSTQPAPYKRNTAEPISIINPIEAQIVENIELQSLTSDRSTRHVEIDINKTDIKYETGDYLGVYPMNEDNIVDDLLNTLNIDGGEVVAIKSTDGMSDFSTPRTIKQHLIENVDLTGRPRKSLFARLSAFATDPETQKRLSSDEYIDFCAREKKGLYQIIKENSIKLSLEHLLSLAPPLLPRYYSIASSPKFKDGIMQLTVGLAKTKTESGATHLGVCSHYIHDLKPGQKARVFVKTSLFRLPQSPETPIIMVAAGCGIAPFHAFMQERKIQCNNTALPYTKSKNLLYFGVYNRTKDFLYEPEFRAYEKEGLLNLRMAFSEEHAPNQPPTFAQHRMIEDMQEIWQLIDKEQANTYVCGHTLLLDGVKEALQRSFTEVGGVPAAEVNDRITKLQNAGRLQVDVY